MTTKTQYGRGLPHILLNGMTLSMLLAKTRDLQSPIEQALMLHNLHETFPLDKKTQAESLKENLKRLKLQISPEISSLNQSILGINMILAGLDFRHKIAKLNTSEILKVVDRRMKAILAPDDAQAMGNELFRRTLSEILYKPAESIRSFLELTHKEQFEGKINSLDGVYKDGIRQALHVCSIGYYTTAVFIAGRTVEELVNEYWLVLFQATKLKPFDLKKISFENKINKLKSEDFLEEDIYHNLSNVRIDRNNFGHPSSKQLNKEEAHLKILVIISEIPKIQKKIVRLRKSQRSRRVV